MKVTMWGTRGSVAAPGPETMRYGGNTSCVEVRGEDGTLLVLDAGTGIRRLGDSLGPELRRVDLLLTHLHMDHILGLGFFDPLFRRDLEVHIWGPSSITLDLRDHLNRYLSPPLFPVRLRDLPCDLELHDVVASGPFSIGNFKINSGLVCHPGPTVGYRIEGEGASIAYLPDHEPALGRGDLPDQDEWVSGLALARGVDLLIHDAQYTDFEYPRHVGWGHSSIAHTLEFARRAGVATLVPFHHDPAHSDAALDRIFAEARTQGILGFGLSPAVEGESFKLGRSARA
jgi:phosphoribosyl 1,2-cyclic phosphodiesterase